MVDQLVADPICVGVVFLSEILVDLNPQVNLAINSMRISLGGTVMIRTIRRIRIAVNVATSGEINRHSSRKGVSIVMCDGGTNCIRSYLNTTVDFPGRRKGARWPHCHTMRSPGYNRAINTPLRFPPSTWPIYVWIDPGSPTGGTSV